MHTSSPKYSLTSVTGTVLTSNIDDSLVCSGSPALRFPGTTRGLVFTVQNNLAVPLTVQSISAGVILLMLRTMLVISTQPRHQAE